MLPSTAQLTDKPVAGRSPRGHLRQPLEVLLRQDLHRRPGDSGLVIVPISHDLDGGSGSVGRLVGDSGGRIFRHFCGNQETLIVCSLGPGGGGDAVGERRSFKRGIFFDNPLLCSSIYSSGVSRQYCSSEGDMWEMCSLMKTEVESAGSCVAG